jgi:PHO85 cyclin-5
MLDTGALIIETIWPNQTIPILNSKILPLRVFIQETIRRSRTSFSTLQLALYYLVRIKSAVLDFEEKNPDWFTTPCNFGKVASKHPIACGRRMFLAAVIIASKYLQDRNYSNRAWAKISGLPVKEINANEFVFLNIADYELYVGEALYKRWSGVLLNHVMATVSVSTPAVVPHSSAGLATPPLTPVMSPVTPGSSIPAPNAIRMALAKRFCEAIKGLSPDLTEAELASLHVLGFQSPQHKPMSPPPSRNGPIVNGRIQRQPNSPPFPLNPLLSQSRMPPYEAALTPPSSDSGSDSEVWSPRSTVSSASSTDSSNISPRANLGRCYLKSLGCALSAKAQSLAPSCLTKRCASPLSIIAACNDRKRGPSVSSMSDSPMSMDDVRPSIPATPRLRLETAPGSAIDEEQDWSSAAGTIDPKLLQLNSSALTAVKGLCSLSQRATVFQPPNAVHGSKRTFGKSYSMGNVQSDYEMAKRRRGAISDQTLARML